MKEMKDQFINLLGIHGVSSKEDEVRSYLYGCLEGLVDHIFIDNYGNLLAEKKIGQRHDATVMLSSHMDTVKEVKKGKNLIINDRFVTADDGALGADDRAGIAIILELMRSIEKVDFEGVIKIALTVEEEIGCRGSSNIDKDFYQDVNAVIIVDRKGNRDLVVGSGSAYCSNELGFFLENAGTVINKNWKCVEGGISDAAIFAAKGLNSINLSCGYYHEHTENEYASFEDMEDTVMLILQFFEMIDETNNMFGQVPEYNKWVTKDNHENWLNRVKRELTTEEMFELHYESDDGAFQVYKVEDDEFILSKGGVEIFLTKDELNDFFQYSTL